MAEIHGSLDARFERLGELLSESVDAGTDVGASVSVTLEGETVVDIWAGWADEARTTPWAHDTIVNVWSTTKTMLTLIALVCAERGLLDLDAPVCTYWPEFAANGKAATTIRHLLSMQAGLYDIRHLIEEPHQLLDHDAMATTLAAASPLHRPGTANGYHAITYGWLVAELVRRITGSSLGAFVQTEIAEPLALDGCYIGTPTDQLDRVAARPRLSPLPSAVRLAGKAADPFTKLLGISPARIAAAFIPIGGHEVIGSTEFLQAEVAAVNGVFTARSLARLYAALGSDDGIDDHRLWSSTTRQLVSVRQTNRRDQVLPIKMGWQLGYHRPFPRKACSPSAFGFYGAYGSGAFADPERRLAVGLTVQEAKGIPLLKLVKPIVEAADQRSR